MTKTLEATTITLEAAGTKERLLEAGTYEFGERGFAAASVRRICARAHANPAAVNYHFGDKQRFYAEVLVACHERATERRPMPRLADDPEHPEEALHAWILWFLDRLLVESKAGPLGKLMAREMFAPSPAFEEVIRRAILPMYQALTEIVEAVLSGAEPAQVQLSVHSVLGQCLLYKHAGPAFERLRHLRDEGLLPAPPAGELMQDLPALARHVTDFSLAGLNRIRAESGREDA